MLRRATRARAFMRHERLLSARAKRMLSTRCFEDAAA